jgi:hypothetical protein
VTYDGLTARFSFSCPATGGAARVRLSAFRTVERLPGAAHPAVYDLTFACPLCGELHESLASHDELDWAPVSPPETPEFYNVMTGRLESAVGELADQAAAHIRQGRWPWCFFCYLEQRPRPVFPSAFRFLAPSENGIVLAAGCPGCGRTSVNVVSEEHVDVPFYSDAEVGVVERVFAPELSLQDLAEELASRALSASRRRLAA